MSEIQVILFLELKREKKVQLTFNENNIPQVFQNQIPLKEIFWEIKYNLSEKGKRHK